MDDEEEQKEITTNKGQSSTSKALFSSVPPPAKTNNPGFLDSGASGTYICVHDCTTLLEDVEPCNDGPTVLLPDNSSIKATHRGVLRMDGLPLSARKAWVFPDLARSLISVATLADAGLSITFDAYKVEVRGPPSGPDAQDGTILLIGPRCRSTLLWTIPVGVSGHQPHDDAPCYDPTLNAMLSQHKTQHEIVDFVHKALFSPVTEVFLEAVKRNFIEFPGLTYGNACKYRPDSIATRLGHMRGKAFRRDRHPEEHNDYFPELLYTKRKPIDQREEATVASMVFELRPEMRTHADISGRFPVTSASGTEYLFVAFCEYANYIHFELMRDRSTAELVGAHTRTYNFFLRRGIRANYLRIDNEVSKELRDYCATQSPPIKIEFVPPNVHRANKSERQMGIAKNHLIAGINTTDRDFVLEAWDTLSWSAELSLNLLRQSGISRYMSAYQQLHGKFDFRKTPIAPPGTKVVVYETPGTRGSFANRGTPAFYVGPAMEHNGCFTVYVPWTKKTRITDTLSWHPPPEWTMPGASPNDVTNALLEQLEAHMRKHGPAFLAAAPQPLPPPDSLIATFLEYARKMHGVNAPDVASSNAPRDQRVPNLPPPPFDRSTQEAEDAAAIASFEASEALARQLEATERAATEPTTEEQKAADSFRTIPPSEQWAKVAGKGRRRKTRPLSSQTKEKPPPAADTDVTKGRQQASKETPAPAPATESPPNLVKHDIGTRFKKLFNKGIFVGRVTEIRPSAKGGKTRRVIYTDGDIEDLTMREIDDCIKKHGKMRGRLANSATQKLTSKQYKALHPRVAIDEMSRHEIQKIIDDFHANLASTTDSSPISSKKQTRKSTRYANAAVQSNAHTIATIDRYGYGAPTLEQLLDLNMSAATLSECTTVLAGAAIPANGVAPITFKSAMNGDDKELWATANSNEFTKLLQGASSAVMTAIHSSAVPAGRHVAYYNPQVKVKTKPDGTVLRRVRGTYGGNTSDYVGDVSALVADITTVKLLLNKVVSNDNYDLCVVDIDDFYLGSPLGRKEYMFVRRDQIPDDIWKTYDLDKYCHSRRNIEGVVFEINKGIYGLPQAGRVAQLRLNKHLAKHGYVQTEDTPCLYKHESRGTYFTLIVDDFLAATTCDDDRNHFLETLKELYAIKYDPEARKYIGITITRDKAKRTIKLSVPGYVANALRRFGIAPQKQRTDAPSPFTKPRYFDKRQQLATVDDSKPLGPKETKFIQEVVGVFGWYARVVDSTLLCAVNKLGSRQAHPTEAVLRDAIQLLHYAATWPDATTVFRPSDMQLQIHSDASYLSETESRSRAAGIAFLTDHDKLGDPDAINGAIDCISTIIKAVVSSAAEAEYAAMFLVGTTAEGLRNTLKDLGHPQGATPIISDNSCAVGIANRTVKQRRSKAIDMRFNWIRDRSDQGHFKVSWAAGPRNRADFFSKSHPTSHHLAMRPIYVEN